MTNLLTTKQVMEYFNVKDSRTITKFINQGLKVIPIGEKDYRFKQEDLEEFTEHLKEQAQEKRIKDNPIPRKHKNNNTKVDFEKIRANRIFNRVI